MSSLREGTPVLPYGGGGGEVTTFAHEAAIMVDICENGVATVGTNGVRVPCGR